MQKNAKHHEDNWLIDNFLAHSVWLMPHLPTPSRMGVLEWLCRHYSKEELNPELGSILMGSSAQREAEKKLINFFLEASKRPVQRRFTGRESRQISRYTDWGRTYSETITRPPFPYRERRISEVPDIEVIRGLAGIATTWRVLLRKIGLVERAKRLQEALQPLPGAWRRPGPFRRAEFERLSRVDKSTAMTLMRGLNYWNQRLGDDEAIGFRDLLSKFTNAHQLSRAKGRRDYLMETTVVLAIARAAELSGRVGGDSEDLGGWQIQSIEITEERKPSLRLVKDGLYCEVSTNKPTVLGGGKDSLDRNAQLLKKIGLDADGYEPDVVIKYWRADNPSQVVYALGDSKRNRSQDGIGYVRSSVKGTASAYMLAFAHLMGAPPRGVNAAHHEIKTAINPAVTLFTYQGSKKIAGVECSDCSRESAIIQALQDEARYPWLMTLDRRYLGETKDGEWRAPVLSAWFERISKQASDALSDNRGFPPPN